MKPRHHRHGVTEWILVMAPLVAAFVQQQIAYELMEFACRHGTALTVHVPTVVSGLVVIATSFIAWRSLARLGLRPPDDGRSGDARERFMAVLALAVGGFALLLIAAQWMPSLFIHPCQR